MRRNEWKIQSEQENLDEKEKLAEAGQQRQKAPQDTVVHISELRRKHSEEGGGGRNERKQKVRGTEIPQRKTAKGGN